MTAQNRYFGEFDTGQRLQTPYFIPLVSGPGRLEWWKNWESKISLDYAFKMSVVTWFYCNISHIQAKHKSTQRKQLSEIEKRKLYEVIQSMNQRRILQATI